MREIKFRAVIKDKNKFVFGNFSNYPDPNITFYNKKNELDVRMIEIKTLGQYTGLKDKNDVEIYEGDITKDKYVIMFHKEKALFAEHFYSTFQKSWNLSSYPISSQGIEIIGNIHEHPHLLTQHKN